MAEPLDDPGPPPRGNFIRKVTDWVKKNKMVAGIIAVGAMLFAVKKGGGESTEGVPIVDEEGNTGATAIQLTPVSASPSEGTFEEEGWREEAERLREEIAEGKKEQPVVEGGNDPSSPEPPEPPEIPNVDNGVPNIPGGGVTIHGRTFDAATGYRRVRDGKDQRGSYIEYLVEFPGFTQRWHYYTGDNKWIKAGDSRGGGGSKPGVPPGERPGGNPPGVGKPIPKVDPAHPKAVNTGNKCVNGGIGSHRAPAGYHLYCGPGGYIWRAPNAPAQKPKSPAPKPNPNPTPKPGGCPDGTANNIRHARNEVNRLQGEINNLTNLINQHPKAQQRSGWIANRSHKQGERDRWQQVVNNGKAQPGCGSV